MKVYKSITFIFALLLIMSLGVSPLSAKIWKLDKAHSSIGFSINHFFTPVKGSFEDFDLDINFDPKDLENSSFNLTVRIASVRTGTEKRDGHLQTEDFFNAEKFPVMTFKSNKIISKGDNMYVAKGKLKIKDVEKDIDLPFKLLGVKIIPEEMQQKMRGLKEAASFQASYSLNRLEYTVGTGSWAATVMVGDEVTIDIAVEAHIR
jgi:polyisoprenoid-binding protein YceI